MDPETKELLKQNFEISKANNELLAKLVRSQKHANITRYIYWGIILFFSFGAYYFIKPVFGNLLNAYGVGGTNGDVISNLSNNKQQIQDFLNSMK